MIIIEVDIFSGRPNPRWILDRDAADEILREVAENPSMVSPSSAVPDHLGYRAILIRSTEEGFAENYGLPDEFALAAATLPRDVAAQSLARRLIESAPLPASEEDELGLDHETRDFILQELGAEGQTDSTNAAQDRPESEPDENLSPMCTVELPAFAPSFWNGSGIIGTNNCYNFATNRRTNSFAQPGRAAYGSNPRWPADMTVAAITGRALADGARRAGNCFAADLAPRMLMALVIAPQQDYHWYRKTSDGLWAHKPGRTASRNRDNSNALIRDPYWCNRGPYTSWGGYFYSSRTMRVV